MRISDWSSDVCSSDLPISQGLVATRSQWFAVRTWEVMEDDLAEIASCAFPTLLQKLVPKGLDIRLTIIGDRAFPVAIETAPDADIDWRSCPNDLIYRPCTLPEPVVDNCKKLLKALRSEEHKSELKSLMTIPY